MPLKFFLMISLVFALKVGTAGQNRFGKIESDFPELETTTKIDEVSDLAEAELAAKIEKLAGFLQQNEKHWLFVINYGALGEPLFRQTSYYLYRKPFKVDRLLAACCSQARITSIYGGLREKRMTEFWLVPPDGKIPNPAGKDLQRELLYRFELLETDYLEFEPVFAQNRDSNETEFGYGIKRKVDLRDLLEIANGVLNQNYERRSVLIYYIDRSISDVEKARLVFERFVQNYGAENKLDLSRVKIVYGGFRRRSEVESWVIPVEELEPETMPDEDFN